MNKITQLGLTAIVFATTGWRAGAQPYHDNVVVLLDTSGSMAQRMGAMSMTRLDAAKQALLTVLSQVPASTHIGLLVFAPNPAEGWMFPLGPQDPERLRQGVNAMRARGGTPLGRFIQVAGDRLIEERAKQFGYGSYRLLVVSDGEAGDPHLVERYTPELLARGITLDVIGVDMENDHTLATRAHSYRRADDAASLTQAISEVFAEVSGAGTADTSEADFNLLEEIPLEVAQAMIETITKIDNRPLDETSAPAETVPAAAPAAPRPPASTGAPPPRQQDGNGGISLGPCCAFLLVAAALVFLRTRTSRRQRPRGG